MAPSPLRLSVVLVAAAFAAGCSDNTPDQGDVPEELTPDVEVAASHGANPPVLTPQQSGTTNRLQAVSPVNTRVVWASGVGGDVTEMANTGSDSLGGTNVTGSKTIVSDSTIDDSSSISINKVINGVNVGYGLGGSTVMGQVTGPGGVPGRTAR